MGQQAKSKPKKLAEAVYNFCLEASFLAALKAIYQTRFLAV